MLSVRHSCREEVLLVTLDEHVDRASRIETPSSIEDLLKRPNYAGSLDPRQHKLVEVLIDYTFDKVVHCGLSTCKQGHFKGFLVRTESGVETNIGHVCGKRHFGDDFDVASATFHRAKDYRDALRRVEVLQQHAPAVISQIQELIDAPFGLRWVHALREAVRDWVGRPARDHLVTRSQRDEYEVSRVEERSDAEIRRIMRERGLKREQVQYRTEVVGRLSPMEWLWWDFRDEVLSKVREPLRPSRASPQQAWTRKNCSVGRVRLAHGNQGFARHRSTWMRRANSSYQTTSPLRTLPSGSFSGWLARARRGAGCPTGLAPSNSPP